MDIFKKWLHISPERANAFSAGRLRLFLEWIICALSGALYATVFAGVDLYILAWFGIIPLYWIIRDCSPKRAFFLSYTWGYFSSLFSFMFLREIVFFIPFGAGFVLGAFPALWGWAVPFFHQNFMIPAQVRLQGPDAVLSYRNGNPFKEIAYCAALAAWWCITEWIRSWIFTGLPWNLVGSSQYQLLPLIQICRYTGVYGVSFLVMMVNLSLGFFLKQLFHAKNVKEGAVHAYSLLFSLALIYMCIMFCGVRNIKYHQKKQYDSQVRIGVVQPNLSQRRSGGESPTLEAIQVCMDLSRKLLRENKDKESSPQILVWPETAVPVAYNSAYELSAKFRKNAGLLTLESKIPLLTGAIYLEQSPAEQNRIDVYNSALLLKAGGRITDLYSKIHLVPFGEYVPYGDTFPILNQLVGMGRNLTPGKEFRPLEIVPGVFAGISICYEDVFSYISQAHAKKGANILLVITNDAWYPTSDEPVQHFANSIFRAVETGLPMIRIGNCNYSAVIDPTGRVTSSVFRKKDGSWDPGRFERGCAVLSVRYEKNPDLTFYTRYGNVFIFVCIFYCLMLWGMALVNCRIYHKAFADALSASKNS